MDSSSQASSKPFISILTPSLHSTVTLSTVCTCSDIDSDYSYDFLPNDDPNINEYFSIIENDVRLGWDKYLFECGKYSLPIIRQLKDCIEEKSKTLNLRGYNPRSISTQLICNILCGPPIVPLTELDFSNSPFSKNGCYTLGEFMQNTMTLESLNLRNCRIGYAGVQILEEGLSIAQTISYLNLSKCNLTDDGGAVVAIAMHSNESCKHLDLSHNSLHIVTGIQIGKMLALNRTIEILNLGWNNFAPELKCSVRIMKGLAKNVALRTFDLSWNSLSGQSFALYLRRALVKHPTLETLNLEYNRLTGEYMKQIGIALLKSVALKSFYISGNTLLADDINFLLHPIDAEISLSILSFGEHYLLSKECQKSIIKILRLNPNLKIIFKGFILANPPAEVDFALILIDRCRFLAMKPKKKKFKRNMGHFFLKVVEVNKEFCTPEEFVEIIKSFRAKLTPALITQLADEFTISSGKKGQNKKVAILKMANYYLDKYPTEPPPPPPPSPIRRKPPVNKKNAAKLEKRRK